MNRKDLTAWSDYLVGKQCPLHPHRIIKEGKWGLYCGEKDKFGVWCNGGWPNQEFINNLRKETNVQQAK
jgi:hypothetical protein